MWTPWPQPNMQQSDTLHTDQRPNYTASHRTRTEHSIMSTVGGSAFVSLLLWELQHCRLYSDTVNLCTACITFRKVLTVNCVIGLHSTKQPVSKDTRRASCDVGTAFLILLRTSISGFKRLTEPQIFLFVELPCVLPV